jgi:hypothetical protein
MGANVISLGEYRLAKRAKLSKDMLYYMSKVQLLEELIRYYEEVKADPYNIDIALWGEDLMEVISQRRLSKELNDLLEENNAEGPLTSLKQFNPSVS